VKKVKTFYKNKRRFIRFVSKVFFTSLYLSTANAQNCPPNIDFETGTFQGWTCYTGSTAAVNGANVITIYPSGPVNNRHTMYSYAANSTDVDPYGGFPVVCPNGSGYSIRLGNNLAGTQAEGVSYQFTIPANQDVYSLIYHYAVVFQDPNHKPEEQPRMEIEITDVTDNRIISCSSFTFIPYGSILPGFFESPNPQGDTPVWCKDWSAVSVNLNGMAGKNIRLFFKTADCTFKKHFGYAYIDVNSECSDEFVGAQFCPDDTAVNVVAPYGYQSYTWFNHSFTKVLGSQQTIRFSPPPTAGTDIAVELKPYNGYGCLDTLYARLIDTLTITANAGRDTVSCNHAPVILGTNAKPGYVYSWSPSAGLSNPTIANPIATPDATTAYIVSTRHDGGGCLTRDTVLIRASIINNSMHLIGKATYCLGSGDSTILAVQPTDSIQWYKDNLAINGANQTQYRVNESGSYYALLFNNDGCSLATEPQDVLIDKARPGITYPVQYAIIDLPVTLEARPFGTTAVWSPGNYLDDPSSYTPIFKGSSDQLFTVKIETITGCETVDTQLVKTITHADIYVPTAFTPNNDGLNDLLRPTLMGMKELLFFRVYNRWGKLLFETKTNGSGWDGRLNGSSMPTQVVVWIAEGIGLDGNIYSRKGTSTLVR
jgi:gliding motility-associated-like protein